MNKAEKENQLKQKDFDCVEMKRKGQERILEMVKDMIPEEEFAFWRKKIKNISSKRGSSQNAKNALRLIKYNFKYNMLEIILKLQQNIKD